MKLKNLQDIESFKSAVDQCKGQVWLESTDGDRFNLKSKFSQYLAIGKLIDDCGEELELYAAEMHDEVILVNCLNSLK